ncbi:MAG: DUF2293 domain-containing protein [Nitratireductor sp.]|nr:DUF2293 domain-containing protein [Nitratireductor sp.]
MTTARQREMAKLLCQLCPLMPLHDFGPVVEAASEKRMKHLPPSVALWQALGARIRHEHTEYDALLAEGYDRDAARFYVLDEMNAVLARWGCHRRIEAQEPE